jgi:restriction system protein
LSPNLNSKPPALDFLWNRPWIVVLIAGFVITPVSRTFSTFGTLLFILGLIAGLGSRRAAHKYALRGAEQGRVDLMYGSSFEHYVGEVMRSSGYRVKHVGGTDHFGADLLAEREGVRSVVQTKCYVGSVGVQAIQEVVAAQAHYLANHAIAVTNSSFSSPAVRLACSNQVELWDRNKLADLARNLPRDTRVSPLSLFGSELAEGFSLSIHFFGAFLIGLVSVSSATGSGRRRRRRR